MGRYEISWEGNTYPPVTWYVISEIIDIYIPVFSYNGVISEGETMTGGIYHSNYTDYHTNYLQIPPYNTIAGSPLPIYASDTLNYYSFSDSKIFGNAPNSMASFIPNNYCILKNYMTDKTRVNAIGCSSTSYNYVYNFGLTYDTNIWLHDSDGNFFRTGQHTRLTGRSELYTVSKIPSNTSLGSASFIPDESVMNRLGWFQMPTGEDYGSTDGDSAILIKSTDDFIKYIDVFTPNENPYGENDQQGGDGTQTDWNTPIPSDGTPTFDITETGFASVFAPTAAQLKSLSEYLWSDLFSVDTLKKLLADPFQALISLHMLPIAVTRGSTKDVAIGNIGTGVSMSLLDAKTYKVDCGTLNIDAYFGSFFDYSPYTTYQIYLPYIGYQSFTPDDFVGGTCQLVYIIDAVTGACVAQLISSKAGGAVLYQFSGSMGYSIPLSASSYQNFVGSVLSAAGSIVGAVKGFKSASGKFAGLDKASAALSGGSSALSAVQASKPDVSRSGSVGGATGWLANQTPYIIRTRPNAIIAKNQQAYTGYPSYQARKLSSLSGFTQVSYINLSLNGATSSEYDEAEKLLKEGVLI